MKRLNIVKEARTVHMVASVLLFIAGIFFIFKVIPAGNVSALGEMGAMARFALGGIFALLGVARLLGYFANDLYRLAFQYDFAMGIFCVVFGVLIAISPDRARTAIPYAIGIYVLLDGLFKLQTAFDAKAFGMKKWVGLMSSSVLVSLAGLWVLLWLGRLPLSFLLGIPLALDGVENGWNTMATVQVRTRGTDRFTDIL